jgi:hypothetical protein
MRNALLRRVATAVLGLTVTTIGLTFATGTSAQAASVKGGQISRTEIASRAQYWVDAGYVYSPDAPTKYSYDNDPGGVSYRDDCSGLISEAWHLSTSYTTADFNVDNSLWTTIPVDSMQMGDAYVRNDSGGNHAELFYKWDDPSDHSQGFEVYSFNNNNYTVENPFAPNNMGYTGHRSYASLAPYHAIRYVNVTGANGPTYDMIRSSGGSWGSNTQIGTNSAVTGVADAEMPDGSMHTLTLVPGSGVYDKTYSGGSWSATTQISTTGSISAIAAVALPNGVLHVETLVPGGGVYDKALSTSGTWTTTQISTNGSISAIAAAELSDGTLHVETLVPGSGVYDKELSISGTWTTTQISFNGAVGAIAAAGSNSELHVYTLVAGSGIWDLSRTVSTGWGAVSQESSNASISDIAAAGSFSGTQIDLYTLVPGSGVYDRQYNSGNDTWTATATKVNADGNVARMAAATLTDGSLHLTTLN